MGADQEAIIGQAGLKAFAGEYLKEGWILSVRRALMMHGFVVGGNQGCPYLDTFACITAVFPGSHLVVLPPVSVPNGVSARTVLLKVNR
jgi:hypothetical protein